MQHLALVCCVLQTAREQGVPVVGLNWLHRCTEAGQVLEPRQHVLPPFTGLHICVTGVEQGVPLCVHLSR